jgi:anti-sigma regulatory factor (Ser/Thr protein kinase)
MNYHDVDELRYCLELPAHPAAVGVARHMVRDIGRDLDAERLERAEIVVSEIVSNAVLHGSQSRRDRVRVDLAAQHDRLTGCVSDHGQRFARDPGPIREDQIGGFGLHIVQELAERWSVDHMQDGNVVRFTI